MKITDEIAQRIGRLMFELKLTQEEMAKKMGFSRGSALMEILKGRNNFNERHIKLFESTFNVSREWLLDGDGPMFNDTLNTSEVNEIGERLVLLRKQLNITQGDFAKSLGFATGNGLSMIERGKSNLQESHLKILEFTYNINREWLLTGEGQMFLTDSHNAFKNENMLIDKVLEMVERKDKQMQQLIDTNASLSNELINFIKGGNELGGERRKARSST